jgi:Flp pilus assembly protein TadD
MKSLVLLFCLFLLVSCGSSSKKDEPASPESSLDAISSNEPVTKPIESAPNKIESPKRETPVNAYAPLSEAYRSQNEEGIYRAAVQILSQNPSDVKALNALGIYHYRKGRPLAARLFFSRAAQSAPRSAEIQNNQGLVSLAIGEEKEAIRSFKKALELNPSDAIAAANLGSIYVQEKDYGKALGVLEIAVRKGNRDAKTLNNYGVSLAAAGKYDEAKSAYNDALKISSNSQETLFNSAVLLIEHLKQYQNGLDQLNRLKSLGPAQDMRNKMNALENKAKTGIK